MVLKTIVSSVMVFASLTGAVNNGAYDSMLRNNNRIPGPVAINNENPKPFIDLRYV